MLRLTGRTLIALFCVASWLMAQPTPPLAISTGRITGKDLGEIRQWKGIPYAAPPVGDLRWKPPQKPVSWDGVRAMDHFGNSCMQPKLLTASAASAQSEDCLTLNIWAPKDARGAAVMFWIHGGAFVEGSGSMPVYDGSQLARQGVIVVTINYRLGDFGLFTTPELTKEPGFESPNFGLMDQIAALHWVHDNIAAFGGDPANVTIFGESAGGTSVNFLMASQPARGLFQRAIAESGGGQSHARTSAAEEQAAARKAQEWGAANLKALRALPASEILEHFGPLGLAEYAPVIDGKYVVLAPAEAFAAGKQAPVPFLLGANSYEASLMPTFRISSERVLDQGGVNRDKVRSLYDSDQLKAARDVFTDSVFLAPARYLAAQMEKVKQPAYLYFFSYVIERMRPQSPGVRHAGEIPFVFDQIPAAVAAIVTAEDRHMADTVSAYWVHFAKTGNPNFDSLPEWPVYRRSSDQLLELGSPIEVRTNFRAEKLNLMDAIAARH